MVARTDHVAGDIIDAAEWNGLAVEVNGIPQKVRDEVAAAPTVTDAAAKAAADRIAAANLARIVTHGADAAVVRPVDVAAGQPVLWFGTVAPANAVTHDEWFDRTDDLIKRYDGAVWIAAGDRKFAATSPVQGGSPTVPVTLLLRKAQPSDPARPPWQEYISGAMHNGVYDFVHYAGWNVDGAGGRVKADQPSYTRNVEYSYNESATGTSMKMEAYDEFVNADGTVRRRPDFKSIDWVTGALNWIINASQITYKIPAAPFTDSPTWLTLSPGVLGMTAPSGAAAQLGLSNVAGSNQPSLLTMQHDGVGAMKLGTVTSTQGELTVGTHGILTLFSNGAASIGNPDPGARLALSNPAGIANPDFQLLLKVVGTALQEEALASFAARGRSMTVTNFADLRFGSTDGGPILIAPAGQAYKIKVSDTGALSAQAV